MKHTSPNRNHLHTTTVPPKNPELSLEDSITKKDPRETTELINKLLESGNEGPNLFNILISSDSTLNLKIPETLYKLQETVYYYHTDEKGFVRTLAGESSIQAFISATKKSKSNENFPSHLFFDNRFRVCLNSKQAREFWHVSQSEVKILQRFIFGNKEKNYKLRVYWKLNTEIRFLLISAELPKIAQCVKIQSVKQLGIYKHKISEYNFAGRLLKTSFDPSLPNRSFIQSKSERKALPGIAQDDSALSKKFLLKFSDRSNSLISEVPPIAAVLETMENIIKYLNHNIQQPSKVALSPQDQSRQNTLSELIVDFLLDDSENWCFFKCKKYKTSLKAPRYSEFYYSKTLRDNNSLNGKKSEALEIASINARLKTIGTRTKEMLNRQKAFASPKAIAELNRDFYSAHFGEINLPSVRSSSQYYNEHMDLYSRHIDKVAEHYDEIRFQAKKNKVDTKRRQSLIDNDQKIRIVVVSALQKLQTYPEIVKNAEIYENFFVGFLTRVLDEEKTLDFFIKFQANFEWDISLKQFRNISAVFAEECKRYGLFGKSDFAMFYRFLQKYEGVIFKNSLSL